MTACQHESVQLVEGGYERTWSLAQGPDGNWTAIFHGLEDFSDEGDGNYSARCAYCLTELPLPDEWDWD